MDPSGGLNSMLLQAAAFRQKMNLPFGGLDWTGLARPPGLAALRFESLLSFAID